MRQTLTLLRRGKPRPRSSALPSSWKYIPQAQRPMQGGQQYFQDFLLRDAEENAASHTRMGNAAAAASGVASGSGAEDLDFTLEASLPQIDASERRLSAEETIQEELRKMRETEAPASQRSFNEREWYEQESGRLSIKTPGGSTTPQAIIPEGAAQAATEEEATSLLPETVSDNAFFESRYGYSMVKDSTLPVTTEYSQLDIWGERPKYGKHMYFLYLISRRRNTYAVCYNFDGKKLLPVYSAGNRGLKGGDRGLRAEGGVEVAHQVTSMYLNDLIPKLREEAAAAKVDPTAASGGKFELVVRVMGFYNGRQGAIRAVMDRSDVFAVRFLEDVTPFPSAAGPRMPKAVL